MIGVSVIIAVAFLLWLNAKNKTVSEGVETPQVAEENRPDGLGDVESKKIESQEAHVGETTIPVSDTTFAETKKSLWGKIKHAFKAHTGWTAELREELEAALISADIGVKTSTKLLDALERKKTSIQSPEEAWAMLKQEVGLMLKQSAPPALTSDRPHMFLVVGVNGVGKTTSIGKLAHHHVSAGKKVLLVAGDTFRAAAVEQIQAWGRRTGAEVVAGEEGKDPSSLMFEAIKKAKAEQVDVVIADTAGRLHTKSNLMEELKKIVRTSEKALGRSVDEILMVIDGTTGQNGLQQVAMFADAVPVGGIVLTKIDGSAKGGIVLAIKDTLNIPVRFVGTGEKAADMKPFNEVEFLEELF